MSQLRLSNWQLKGHTWTTGTSVLPEPCLRMFWLSCTLQKFLKFNENYGFVASLGKSRGHPTLGLHSGWLSPGAEQWPPPQVFGVHVTQCTPVPPGLPSLTVLSGWPLCALVSAASATPESVLGLLGWHALRQNVGLYPIWESNES